MQTVDRPAHLGDALAGACADVARVPHRALPPAASSSSAPQGLVCGNTMSGNTGGNSVGTYAGQFNPTAACP